MKKTSHLGNPLFSDWTELYDKESRAMIQILERKKDWKTRMKGSFLLTQETQLAHPKHYDDLLAKLHQTEFKASTYKRGLDTVKAQLVTYRKNEVLFSEEVAVLKREVGCKTYEFNMLKTEFENVKQEKEGIDFKIEKFENASKDLDKLLGSQITDNSKKGLGYHVVPPPHPLIYNAPTKHDLSYSGLEDMADLLLEEKLSQALQALCEKLNKNVQEKQEEKNVAEEQAAKVSSQYWKPPIYYDDDDD
ncbi:hypothetical protein Tco_0786681 [Tanacetum coccineum]